jgi:hypothetical protein
MRFLPREHGATVIWFASVIASLLISPVIPPPTFLIFFLVISIIILLSAGHITNRSPKMIRIQRNRFFLPILSGGVTTLMPLGVAIMFGAISEKVLAAWLLMFTYTVISVSLIQVKVRTLLRREDLQSNRAVALGLTGIVAEVSFLVTIGLMHLAAVFAPAQLTLWIYLSHRLEERKANKVRVIRKIGFLQTANMLIFVMILAAITRL